MATDSVRVPVGQLTVQQLLVHLVHEHDKTRTQLNRLERIVSDLTVAVDDLKASVDGVAQRLLPEIDALEAANAVLTTNLAAALADDDEAAAAAADAVTAVSNIRTEIARLNALGAEPETPVDPDPADPVEPPVVDPEPTPVDPEPAPADPEV